jgi:ERCC4-type nuclease
LASKLTGWKIDIKSESKMEKISAEILEAFKGLPYVGDVTSRVLYNEGFRSVKDIAEVDPEDLGRVLEIEKEKALEITEKARELAQGEGKPAEGGVPQPAPASGPGLESVDRLEGVGEKTADVLKSGGFQTIQDILNSDAEKLSDLPGIGVKKAEKLIQAAQEYSQREKGE